MLKRTYSCNLPLLKRDFAYIPCGPRRPVAWPPCALPVPGCPTNDWLRGLRQDMYFRRLADYLTSPRWMPKQRNRDFGQMGQEGIKTSQSVEHLGSHLGRRLIKTTLFRCSWHSSVVITITPVDRPSTLSRVTYRPVTLVFSHHANFNCD